MFGIAKESSNRKKRKVEEKWSLVRLFTELGTSEMCIKFAEDNNLLPKTMMCTLHKTSMFLKQPDSNRVGKFYCIGDSCRSKTLISQAKGTLFENADLCLPRIFYLMYSFLRRYDVESTQREDFIKDGTKLSHNAILDWQAHFRRVIVKYHLNHQEHRGKVGGPGRIIRLYEYNFWDKKHYRDGGWILGIIEEGRDDLRLELCPQDQHSSEVIMPLIQKHVIRGSTICMHAARNYDFISDYNYVPCNINTCDILNPNAAHRRLMIRLFNINISSTKTIAAEEISECLWRKNMKKKKQQAFNGLIEAVKYVYNEN